MKGVSNIAPEECNREKIEWISLSGKPFYTAIGASTICNGWQIPNLPKPKIHPTHDGGEHFPNAGL
jgi:hypothetical protein